MKNNHQSKNHHWWPQCVSKEWFNRNGILYHLRSDGTIIEQTNTKSFGAINHGHTFKLGNNQSTPWDQNFENFFDNADNIFPSILNWLKELNYQATDNSSNIFNGSNEFKTRFTSQPITQQQFDNLMECILSLVVRSPRFRNTIKSNVEHCRSDLGFSDPNPGNAIVNLNLRDALGKFVDGINGRGKLAVLFSPKTDFIFGDGFYHTYTDSSNAPHNPKILIPLLPNICVFFTKPLIYSTEPRMVTIGINADETKFINELTMIYSGREIFYRSQKPELITEFLSGQFLEFEYNAHPAIKHLSNLLIT
jgi:hypothetical protein